MANTKKAATVVAGNPAELAIQPNVHEYERREDDMGNGIKRVTYYVKKDEE
ncbi:hypothetical protein HMPREF7215_2574 [Pyramidobacter piscolens W5455]|uniref:Uncharacterized protein n=1 Tax=Pyramidobacter piscolens W5455 TaxID=352165 RepID=A0ABM9ZSE2_9BACT|nr:hypothetical protein [Pyramidobacter piscolens]EFB89760.1 hypothetical protein HMPREF7215_2574 [Pyramidobacter piscolens W5455]